MDNELETVMRTTGMGEMQARRHLEQRARLRQQYAEKQRRAARECVERYAQRCAKENGRA